MSLKRSLVFIITLASVASSACSGQGVVSQPPDDSEEAPTATARKALTGDVTVGALIEVMFPALLRAEPKRNASVLASLPAETQVTAVQSSPQNDYYLLRFGTEQGWVKGYALTPAIPEAHAPVSVGSTSTQPPLPPPPSPSPTPMSGCSTGCFYVSTAGSDSNPGTQAAPWRTLGHAAATMGPGDTTFVMDGTYEEDTVRFSNQGTAAMRITLKAQNSRQAILASLAPNSCQPAFNVHGSYITIEGIRVMASPSAATCTTYGSGMAFRFWHTNTVIIGGIQSTGTVGGVMRDVQVDFHTSFSMSAKTSQDDMLVENSTFYGELEAFNSNHVVYRNNVIYNGGPNGNYISGKGGVRNLLLYGNVVHLTTVASPASWALGLSCGQVSGPQWDYDPSTGWESYNCAAFNNVILNETGSASVNGMGPQGALDSFFFNNVLLNGAYFQSRTGGAGQQSQNVTLKNNIFSCNGGQAVSTGPTGTFTVDYNLFFGCAGAPNQAHPILGDPMFVDPASDWHLRPGSPAIGSGVPVTMMGYYGESLDVSRDTDSNIRTAPWNLGVY